VAELTHNMVDIHAHLLPGLDDGPVDWEESLQMCRAYVAQGIHTVVATPHMGDGLFQVAPEDAREAVRRLRQACARQSIPLCVLPGADVRVHPEMIALLDEGRLLTVADAGRHLMIELPEQTVPPMEGLLFELAVRGVVPILSHPERNLAVMHNPQLAAKLAEMGCLLQVTAGALLGAFGAPARRTAERLLKAGLVHVVATDAHAAEGPRSPEVGPALARLRQLVGEDELRRLVHDAPARVACAAAPTQASAGGAARP